MTRTGLLAVVACAFSGDPGYLSVRVGLDRIGRRGQDPSAPQAGSPLQSCLALGCRDLVGLGPRLL
jgi:hypothetical protein